MLESRSPVALLVAIVCMALSGPVCSDAGQDSGWLSAEGYYRVSVDSRLDPIVINRIHSWVIRVTTASGEPVSDAMLTVGGGMPVHDHGMPTNPRMTRNYGDGRYLIEGMRFHMNGDWEIAVEIVVQDRHDAVVILLTL